jgi:hypothetical protein
MHRIFYVEDVVRIIVLEACKTDAEDVHPWWFAHERRPESTRTVLARTCRVFSEPALDLIWNAPPPGALAQLMSKNTWTVVPEWRGVSDHMLKKPRVRLYRWLSSKPVVLRRPGLDRFLERVLWNKRCRPVDRLLVSKWLFQPLHCSQRTQTLSNPSSTLTTERIGERFSLYAKRVRSLQVLCRKVDLADNFHVDISVVAAWIAIEGLFPAWNTLTMDNSAPPSLYRGLSLHASFITSLDLTVERWYMPPQDEGRGVLLGLCSHLETLRISMGYLKADDESWTEFLVEMIAHTQHLRRFAALLVPPKVILQALAHNPALGDLEAITSASCRKETRHMQQQPHTPGFHPAPDTDLQVSTQLKRLSLLDRSFHMDMARRILEMKANTCLHTCDLHFHHPLDRILTCDADVSDVLLLLSRHTSLVHLQLFIDAAKGPLSGPEMPMNTIVTPLYALHELRTLAIQMVISTPLERATLDALLSACPHLQSWTMRSTFFTFPRDLCELTLYEFLDILHDRPLLKELPVRLTIGQVPHVEYWPAMGTHGYGPELTIQPLDSSETMRNSEELHTMIRRIFPNVHGLCLCEQDSIIMLNV